MKKLFSLIAILFIPLLFSQSELLGQEKQYKKPLIGISSYIDGISAKLSMTYIESVRRAGGIPVVIPLTTDTTQISEIVSVLDALIMSGGEDIDPAYFGEEPHPNLGEVVPDRDKFDVALIERVIAEGKPLLAICRGEQVLNVVLGGSLYQDIPSQLPESIQHQQNIPRDKGSHSIKIVENSLLHKLLNVDSLEVNSFHHQSVKNLGKGLKITATSSDGVVEAIELEGKQVLGVQFHPEGFVYSGDLTFLPIFEWLVKAAVINRKEE